MTFSIIKVEGKIKFYQVGRVVYTILFDKDLPHFEKLQLSNKIYNNPEVFLTKDFFDIFEKLIELMKTQDELFKEIATFSRKNIQEVKFIKQNLEEIESTAVRFEKTLNKYISSKDLETVTDCTNTKKIQSTYLSSFLYENFWFEVFCYYAIHKYIQEKKNSLTRGKQYEIILSQSITGKDFTHQIDIIVIINDKIILCSCKSGNVERKEILAFSEQKRKINADKGIIFFYNEYTEKYDSDSIYPLHSIKEKTFEELKKELDIIFNQILQ